MAVETLEQLPRAGQDESPVRRLGNFSVIVGELVCSLDDDYVKEICSQED